MKLKHLFSLLAVSSLATTASSQSLVVLAYNESVHVFRTSGEEVMQRDHQTERALSAPRTIRGTKFRNAVEARTLMQIWIKRFTACKPGDSASSTRNAWVRERLKDADDVNGAQYRIDADLMGVVQIGVDHFLVTKGGSAILVDRRTQEVVPETPCGASVQGYSVSRDMNLIGFIVQDTEIGYPLNGLGISFKRARNFKLSVVDLASGSVREVPMADRQPVDILFLEGGGWLTLGVKWSGGLHNPVNWLPALAGHPSQYANVTLSRFNDTGSVLDTQEIVSGVKLSSARLIRVDD